MPNYGGTKYTHTFEDMELLINSQRHLSHCKDQENWIEQFGVTYDALTKTRLQRGEWAGFVEELELAKFENQYGPRFINLYYPVGVLERLRIDYGLLCPTCVKTYGNEEYCRNELDDFENYGRKTYEDNNYYRYCGAKLFKVFDPIPEEIAARTYCVRSRDLYNGRPPACYSCLFPFLQKVRWRRDLRRYEDFDRVIEHITDEEAELYATEFILFHMTKTAKEFRNSKSKKPRQPINNLTGNKETV